MNNTVIKNDILKQTPLVSIIILNYNGMPFLEKCIKTIESQTYKKIETIIFDNVSTDESVMYIQKHWRKIRLITSKKNLLFAKGNNEAEKYAQGEFLFFLNNDTYLHERCIEELVAAIDPKVGVYAPTMMDYGGKEIIELGMGMDIYAFPWQELTENIFYVEGSGLFISKKLWKKVGGFDERMVNVAEDLDLCWRIQLLGYTIKKVPNAIFYHYGGATLGGTNTASNKSKKTYQTSLIKRYYGEKNQWLAMMKNYGTASLLKILPKYYFWKILEIGYLLLKRQTTMVFQAYIKAHWWNMVHLRETLQERKKIQSARIVDDIVIHKRIIQSNARLKMLKMVGLPVLKKSLSSKI